MENVKSCSINNPHLQVWESKDAKGINEPDSVG